MLTEYRNGWLIRTVTKSFAVYAATATEKQEWMAHITKCIEDLLRKSKKKFYFANIFRLMVIALVIIVIVIVTVVMVVVIIMISFTDLLIKNYK